MLICSKIQQVVEIPSGEEGEETASANGIQGFFTVRSNRMVRAASLIKSVRFMCMSAEELCDHVEQVDFMRTTAECSVLLVEAYKWHALPRRQPLMECEQAKLRSHQVLIAVSETNIYALNVRLDKWLLLCLAPEMVNHVKNG